MLTKNSILPLKPKPTRMALIGGFTTVVDGGSYASNNSTDIRRTKSFCLSMHFAFCVDNVTLVQGCDFVDTDADSGI